MILYYNFHAEFLILHSELKNGAVGVTVDGSSAVATGSFVTFALVISVIFNILVGGYVISQLAATERMDNK